ncbi:mannitol-1-phosphate 5-dehydrogenase, partial [bacterium]|nr:mannitol-1-phosphate 5-dehydrogenase [bacterium]
LPVDKKAFKGKIPEIKGLYPVDNLYRYEELKLFGHNLSHACLAYLGYLYGYKYIWESIRDKKISVILKEVQKEVMEALIKKHKFEKEEIENYFFDLNKRFDNKLLNDTVYRVGREPLRKIGKNERIAGAINLCLSQNIFPENVCIVAAACLCYNYLDDPEAVKLENLIKEKGERYILENIAGIREKKILKLIEKYYEELKNESRSIKRYRKP